MRNVVIIGSGCAGNTAAIYAARANLKPLVVAGHEAGGQLSLTHMVENFPGFPEGINGPDLVENMRLQAQNFGAEYLMGSVIDTDLSQRPFRLNVEGEWIETRTRDRRQRGQRALAGAPQRTETDRQRREQLRHLRRLLLSRQEDHRDRRRRFRHGRGQFPLPLRQRSHPGASPRRVPRLQDHAGSRPP